MTASARPVAYPRGAFRHEALFYAGQRQFVAAAAEFITDAVAAEEPVLVVVDQPKIDALREEIGHDESVEFADMARVGANPGRIIPVWRHFVAAHAGRGRRVRGIGEPVGPQRSAEELVECRRHESLLNLAFAEAPAWWLLCPYDTVALAPDVVADARRTHPFLMEGGTQAASPDYEGLAPATALFDRPLAPAPAHAARMSLQAGSLRMLRGFVADHAAAAGLDAGRAADLVVAVNELATNSLRHGDGCGVVRIWGDGGAVLCEVADEGTLRDPLAGRRTPGRGQRAGRGMWLVNQLCDLVQVRSSAEGTVVRVHMRW